MNADQQFIIALLSPILALITTVVVAWLAYLTTTTKNHVEGLAKSVNGMKNELVTRARSDAFDEGDKLGAGRINSPEADQRADARSLALSDLATEAALPHEKGIVHP